MRWTHIDAMVHVIVWGTHAILWFELRISLQASDACRKGVVAHVAIPLRDLCRL